MTVIINKPGFNLRETLTSLKRKIGIKGAELMAAETAEDVYNVIGTNRNRVINGAMMIDQRNAGASVSYTTSSPAYCIDRWYGQAVSSAGSFTLQQSTDTPAGFSNSLKATVTTASTPSGTQVYRVIQRIEGYNTADLALGTANAKAMTLSFWVKSSITGTFGGSLWGGSATAWFPFSYVINSVNTWEYKTVSIGAASSTPATAFNTTTGVGLQLTFNLGAGSSVITTPGSWIYGSTEYYGATGQTNLIATNGATFQLTGVQLEKGTVATPFEHRPYGTELALCERYYQVQQGFAVGSYSSGTTFFIFKPRVTMAKQAPSGIGISEHYASTNRTVYASNGSYSVGDGTYGWNSGGLIGSTQYGWVFHGGGVATLPVGSYGYAPALVLAFSGEL